MCGHIGQNVCKYKCECKCRYGMSLWMQMQVWDVFMNENVGMGCLYECKCRYEVWDVFMNANVGMGCLYECKCRSGMS